MLATIIQGFKDYFQIIVYKLPLLIIAIIVFFLFWGFAKLIKMFLDRFFKNLNIESHQKHLIGYLLNIIILTLGAITALSVLGFNLTALITGVGLTGLILGFALQDVLKNFFSGIIILIQKPFKVGDQILIDEYSGKVKEIKTRYTILRTFDGNDVILPNQLILNKNLVCTTSFPKRRSDFTLKIRDDNSIKRAVEKGLEALKQTSGVIEQPTPQVWINKIENGSITLRFFFWWTCWQERNEILPIKSLALKNVKEKFDREGITLTK